MSITSIYQIRYTRRDVRVRSLIVAVIVLAVPGGLAVVASAEADVLPIRPMSLILRSDRSERRAAGVVPDIRWLDAEWVVRQLLRWRLDLWFSPSTATRATALFRAPLPMRSHHSTSPSSCSTIAVTAAIQDRQPKKGSRLDARARAKLPPDPPGRRFATSRVFRRVARNGRRSRAGGRPSAGSADSSVTVHVGNGRRSHHYPWLPVGWILRDRFATLDRMHGHSRTALRDRRRSQTASCRSRRARRVFEAATSPKSACHPDADHNDGSLFTGRP